MLYIKDNKEIEEIKSISTRDGLNINDRLFDLFRLFKIDTLCLKNRMKKFKGYSVSEILTVLVLFPFMAIATHDGLEFKLSASCENL